MVTTDEDLFWITGAYDPIDETLHLEMREPIEWVSFSYGPFRTQEEGLARAADREKMLEVLGRETAKDFDIDCVERLNYGGACSHFIETIPSEHFEEWQAECMRQWEQEQERQAAVALRKGWAPVP